MHLLYKKRRHSFFEFRAHFDYTLLVHAVPLYIHKFTLMVQRCICNVAFLIQLDLLDVAYVVLSIFLN